MLKKTLDEYWDKKTELRKTIIHATKRVEYPWYPANREQKFHRTDKVERKQRNSIKRQVIKEFCIDSRG